MACVKGLSKKYMIVMGWLLDKEEGPWPCSSCGTVLSQPLLY